MNKKMLRNLFISVVALAVLSGAYYFVMKMPEKDAAEEEPTYTPTPYVEVLNLKSDDISEVNINNPENIFTVARAEENKFYVKEYDLNFSKSKLNSVLLDFATINAEKELTEEGDYGFPESGIVTNITMKDGTLYSLTLGNKVSGSNSYFLNYDNKTYVISEYEGSNFLKTLNSLRETNILTIDNPSISAFSVDKNGKNLVDIREIREDEKDKFSMVTSHVMTNPSYVSVSMDNYGAIVQEITGVTAVDFPDDNDPSKYGIGKLKFKLTDKDKTVTILFGEKDEKGNVYAQLEGENYLFITAPALFDTLYNIDPQALMDKFVLLVNIEKITGLEFFGGGKNYNFIIDGEGDNAKYYINDKEIKDDAFKKAYQAVIGLSTNGFNEKYAGNTDYTIIYNYKDGNQDVCEFKNYDERNYAVFVNNKSEFIILKKKLTAAMEAIEGFFMQ